MVYVLHPRGNAQTLSAEHLQRIMPVMPDEVAPTTPAAGIEAFRGWSILAVILIGYPLGHSIVTRGFGASWTINAYNAVFLIGALLLQGRPREPGPGLRRRRPHGVGGHPAVSVLRRDLRDHQQHRPGRLAG